MLIEVPAKEFSSIREYYTMTVLCNKFSFSCFVLYVHVWMFIVFCFWNKTSSQCWFTYFQLLYDKMFLLCVWNDLIQSLEASFYFWFMEQHLLFIGIIKRLICSDVQQ